MVARCGEVKPTPADMRMKIFVSFHEKLTWHVVIGSAVALARPSEWTEEDGEEERKTGPHVDILELEDAVELAGGFGQPDAVEAQGSDDNVTASG